MVDSWWMMLLFPIWIGIAFNVAAATLNVALMSTEGILMSRFSRWWLDYQVRIMIIVWTLLCAWSFLNGVIYWSG